MLRAQTQLLSVEVTETVQVCDLFLIFCSECTSIFSSCLLECFLLFFLMTTQRHISFLLGQNIPVLIELHLKNMLIFNHSHKNSTLSWVRLVILTVDTYFVKVIVTPCSDLSLVNEFCKMLKTATGET